MQEPVEPSSKRQKQDVKDLTTLRKDIEALKKKKAAFGEVQQAYEALVELYPLSGTAWSEYAEFTIKNNEREATEDIFKRALPRVPSTRIFEVYIAFVQKAHPLAEPANFSIVAQAYEFALGKIQYDKLSGPIFQQYIGLLDKRPTATTWEQQHKMDELRKTYRKAVTIPISNIEPLWRSYNSFEQGVSRATARKFIDERSGAYMQARSCFRERESITSAIRAEDLPKPREFTQQELQQLQNWQKLLSFELANPLGLDEATLKERIYYIYRQSLGALCFFPEMWYEAIQWCLDAKCNDEALELSELGFETNPLSFALTARLATLHEESDRSEQVFEAWRRLIANLEKEHRKTPVYSERITIAYVELMQATKRLSGVQASRLISAECRKLPYCTYHIYTASAEHEDPSSALKIYEIAYKRYRHETAFIQSYLKFLFNARDMLNARVVFEKSLNDFGPHEARPIYDQFLEYEATFADLTVLRRLESRYRELYEVSLIDLVARRYQQYFSDPVGQELHLQPQQAKAIEYPPSLRQMLSKLPKESVGVQVKISELLATVQKAC